MWSGSPSVVCRTTSRASLATPRKSAAFAACWARLGVEQPLQSTIQASVSMGVLK